MLEPETGGSRLCDRIHIESVLSQANQAQLKKDTRMRIQQCIAGRMGGLEKKLSAEICFCDQICGNQIIILKTVIVRGINGISAQTRSQIANSANSANNAK